MLQTPPRNLKRKRAPTPKTPVAISVLHKISALVPQQNQRRVTTTRSTAELVDYLSSQALLSVQILKELSVTDVRALCLISPEPFKRIYNEEALRESTSLVKALTETPSFASLIDLTLDGRPLTPTHLLMIKDLPLQTLSINNTNLESLAVAMLVPLKDTLHELCLASNPHLDDAAIPFAIRLVHLEFVTFHETNIGMPGLRQLAQAMHAREIGLYVEPSTACMEYLKRQEQVPANVTAQDLKGLGEEDLAICHSAMVELRRGDDLVRQMIAGKHSVPSSCSPPPLLRLFHHQGSRFEDLQHSPVPVDVPDLISDSNSDTESASPILQTLLPIASAAGSRGDPQSDSETEEEDQADISARLGNRKIRLASPAQLPLWMRRNQEAMDID
ncbi:hypothetical protein B0H11DRAFT_2126752 [Mycena galericulata]|nr:hypothetical protein B0H11DRAFT_2126752 [Mycena galericulata]